jgi:hypothetical protein
MLRGIGDSAHNGRSGYARGITEPFGTTSRKISGSALVNEMFDELTSCIHSAVLERTVGRWFEKYGA